MSPGSGYGYNQAQFSSGHSTQRAVMMRQKSMGGFKCNRCWIHLFSIQLHRNSMWSLCNCVLHVFCPKEWPRRRGYISTLLKWSCLVVFLCLDLRTSPLHPTLQRLSRPCLPAATQTGERHQHIFMLSLLCLHRTTCLIARHSTGCHPTAG